jgi:hypothetical protein
MKRRAVLIGIGAMPWLAQPALAQDSGLVLVASARSSLPMLSGEETRKLYLGIPFTHAGREVVPLINNTNAQVRELFLQKVLFMSAQTFERQSVGRVFRNGGNRIAEFQQLPELSAALAADPNSVSFMMPATVGTLSGVKVLSELWRP